MAVRRSVPAAGDSDAAVHWHCPHQGQSLHPTRRPGALCRHWHWHPTVLPGWARCQNDALGGLLVSAVPFRPTGTQAGSVTVPFATSRLFRRTPLSSSARVDSALAYWHSRATAFMRSICPPHRQSAVGQKAGIGISGPAFCPRLSAFVTWNGGPNSNIRSCAVAGRNPDY